MGFKTTDWEFSNEVDATSIPPVEGVQFAQIKNAQYKEDDGTYIITLQSLTNDAEFTLHYWLFSKDENGATIKNSRNRGTLISLGRALAGEPIGIPNPVDIVGCMVKIDLKFSKPDMKGASYPRVYVFMPVPEDIAVLSIKEQYFEPDQ